MITRIVRHLTRTWTDRTTSRRLRRELDETLRREISARDLHACLSGHGVEMHDRERPLMRGRSGRLHTIDMRIDDALRDGDVTSVAECVMDAMLPVLRLWTALEALSSLGPEIRRRDGGTRRLPLRDPPRCVWRAHPAVLNLAAMMGIDPANLVEGKEDRGRTTIDHTTKWPERTYWRIGHKAAARDDAMPGHRQFDVHHVLTAGARGSGLRRIESDAQGVTLDVLVDGIIPDTLLGVMMNAGLPALVSDWRELSHAPCRGEIVDVQDATTWRQRGSQRLYRFTLADEPYVGIEPMPDGMDTTWMDPTWGMAREAR
jgi:hypothetical protein